MQISPLSTEEKSYFYQLRQENLVKDQQQLEQFMLYAQLLREWNARHNLTTIVDIKEMVELHFKDSLMVQKYLDFNTIACIADIGAGAGFPGLPLKICFPHLHLVIIEVNKKKVEFLQNVAHALALDGIDYYTDDWRTFLRKSTYAVDYFVTRASLAQEELIRAFQPSSPYKDSGIIYWASTKWIPEKKVEPYIQREVPYRIKNRNNRYIFLKRIP